MGIERGHWWLVLMSALCFLRGVRAPSIPPRNTSAETSINVISVENLDNMLRMRLVDDVPSLNHSGTDGVTRERARRATENLCQRPSCQCANIATKWKNISCYFTKPEVLELGPGSLPDNLLELELRNLSELIISPKTFGNTPALKSVILSRIGKIRMQTSAFFNISSAQFSLIIEESGSITLDDHSFRNMKGPISVTINSCKSLSLGAFVFGRLLQLSIKNVPILVLDKSTFATESTKMLHHGPAPEISFQNVNFGVIPNETFVSNAGTISFRDCKIERISRGTFHAMQISRVLLENTDLMTLETGAFSERTLILNLELNKVHIKTVEQIIMNAVENLTIRDSTLQEVRDDAFKLTAARVHIIGNHFTTIGRRAFGVHAWSNVIISNNEFEKMDPEAFFLPFHTASGIEKYVFQFTDNLLRNASVGSLAFIPLEDEVEVIVDKNRFFETCSCRLKTLCADLVESNPQRKGSNELAERLFETSLCSVTDWLAHCFPLTAGAMTMVNYTNQICGSEKELLCEEPSPRFYPPNPNLDWDKLLNPEKRLVTIIFVTVLICVTFILIVVTARWVQRKGLISRIMSQFFRTSSLVATASISRINIHEYAEIQNLRNQTQVPEESDEEDVVAVDDKATQTLPEELTQDLLQSLREKLDDPENYREARDMIEHLYDLIKVEESCNTRNSVVEDSLYAEIQPRMRPRVRNTMGTSVGTRSPSLDRLAPVHYLPRPAVVNDYSEPRDRQISSQLYCELPGGVPDVLVSSHLMANRPLPEAPSGSEI